MSKANPLGVALLSKHLLYPQRASLTGLPDLPDRPQTIRKGGIDKGYKNWGAAGITSLLAMTKGNSPRHYS